MSSHDMFYDVNRLVLWQKEGEFEYELWVMSYELWIISVIYELLVVNYELRVMSKFWGYKSINLFKNQIMHYDKKGDIVCIT